MSERYKKSYRGYLIDHHSPNLESITLDKLDIDEYETFFKEAHINNLMLYCKDHWGYSYYNTETGTRHPALKSDWVKKVSEILKKNDIEFTAYYCLEYDNLAPEVNKEWQNLKSDGEMLRCKSPIAKWGMPCYETDYRKYVLKHLEEIVKGYKPDSLFLDIFGKSLCYCSICTKKFNEKYGYDLPTTDEELINKSKDIIEFLDESGLHMIKEIRDTVKGIDPDIKITINFAALYNKEIRDSLDYQFTEPWAGNWLSAAYSRDTAEGQFPQLGPGDISEVYNYKHENIYILAASQIAAQGCRVFMYSGSQHVDGTLEHEESKRVGAAYKEVEKFEEYLYDRELVADVAIIQSDYASQKIKQDKIIANAIGRVRKNSPHREALLGAMKICDQMKVTWKVVPEQNVKEHILSKFKIVLLPSVYYINPQLKEELKDFVTRGGVVITDCESGFYDAKGMMKSTYEMENLYGIRFNEINKVYKDNPWQSYLKFKDLGTDMNIIKTYPAVLGNIPQVENTSIVGTTVEATTLEYSIHHISLEGAEALAYFVNPATELTSTKWVNWWSPPPAQVTNQTAITVNNYEKGKVIFCGFNIFNMRNKEFNWLDEFFSFLFNKYMDNKRIHLETNIPNIVSFTAFERKDKHELIIHEISKIAELADGNVVAVEGGKLCIDRGFREIQTAEIVYPVYRELNCVKERDQVYIELPRLEIHQVIKLKYL